MIAEAPALVIWQVGTNAVFHKEIYSLDEVAAAIAAGLDWLAATPDRCRADGPAIHDGARVTDKIGFAERHGVADIAAAEKASVNVFRRFALMRRWRCRTTSRFEQLIDPDDNGQLHHERLGTRLRHEGAVRSNYDGASVPRRRPASAIRPIR